MIIRVQIFDGRQAQLRLLHARLPVPRAGKAAPRARPRIAPPHFATDPDMITREKSRKIVQRHGIQRVDSLRPKWRQLQTSRRLLVSRTRKHNQLHVVHKTLLRRRPPTSTMLSARTPLARVEKRRLKALEYTADNVPIGLKTRERRRGWTGGGCWCSYV